MILKECAVCKGVSFSYVCSSCREILNEEIYLSKIKLSDYFSVFYSSHYIGLMECIIRSYKFDCNKGLAKIFVNLLGDFIQKEQIDISSTLFIPVPSSKKGIKERGFNQVEYILEKAKLPYISLVLLNKNHKNIVQKTLKREDKFKVSLGKFLINKKQEIGINSDIKKIIIIDDVCTTGATLFSIYSLLKEYLERRNLNNVEIMCYVIAKSGNLV